MAGDVLVAADYSALEVVILADLTLRLFGDDQLAKAVQPGAPDIHATNAKYIWGEFLGWKIPREFKVDGKPVLCPYAGERVDSIPTDEFKKHPYGSFIRGNTKTAFFGWCYGKRGYGFSTLPDAEGRPIGEELGEKLCEGLLLAMPGLGKWERWVESYIDRYHGIYSLDGRWCDLSLEMEGEEWQRRRAYRRGLNFPAQATAAGIIGDAMVRISRDTELAALGYRVFLQEHDALMLYGPEEHVVRAMELVKLHMEEATANGVPLLVPLQVSISYGGNLAVK